MLREECGASLERRETEVPVMHHTSTHGRCERATQRRRKTMKTKLTVLGATTLALGLTATALAGPTDGLRQAVSPPIWQAAKPSPYALTGTPSETHLGSTGARGRKQREVQRIGNKVEVDTFRR